MNERVSDDDSQLIIAIDFGTVYSAVAYRWHDDLHDILFPYNNSAIKVPIVRSQILCLEGTYLVGSEVDDHVETQKNFSEEDRITLFKLGLDDSDVTAGIRKTLSEQIGKLPPATFEGEESPRKPVLGDLIAKFLHQLYLRTLDDLKKNKEGIGKSMIESAKCIIGVPPCWSLKSTQAMVKAAEHAGIPNIQIITEIEAVVSQYVQESKQDMLSGAVLIYDVGGGITKVGLFEVVSQKPIQLQELAPVKSILNGSCFWNEAFKKFIVHYTKEWMPKFEKDTSSTKEEILRTMMTSFEKQKTQFTGESDVRIQIAGIKGVSKHVIDNCVIVTKEDMAGIARAWAKLNIEIIEEVIRTFDKKNRASKLRIQKILAVGATMNNDFIWRVHLQELSKFDISMKQLHANSASVVCMGAIHMAAQPSELITMRYALSSFGACWDEPYNIHKHGKVKTAIDPHDGLKTVPRRVKWLIHKGQEIHQNTEASLKGERAFADDLRFRETIFSSDVTVKDHLSVDDPKNYIKEEGELEVELDQQMVKNFPKHENPRTKESFSWLEYDLRLLINYPVIEFKFIYPSSGRFPDKNLITKKAQFKSAAGFQSIRPYTAPEQDDVEASDVMLTQKRTRTVDVSRLYSELRDVCWDHVYEEVAVKGMHVEGACYGDLVIILAYLYRGIRRLENKIILWVLSSKRVNIIYSSSGASKSTDMMKVFNKLIKDVLRKTTSEWDLALQDAAVFVNNTRIDFLGFSATEILFDLVRKNRPLRPPCLTRMERKEVDLDPSRFRHARRRSQKIHDL